MSCPNCGKINSKSYRSMFPGGRRIKHVVKKRKYQDYVVGDIDTILKVGDHVRRISGEFMGMKVNDYDIVKNVSNNKNHSDVELRKFTGGVHDIKSLIKVNKDFKVGCTVKRTYYKEHYGMIQGNIATVIKVNEGDNSVRLVEYEGNHSMYALEVIVEKSQIETKEVITEKGDTMNKTIVKLFPKTEDAVLVEEMMGREVGTKFIDALVLAPHADAILTEAKRLKVLNDINIRTHDGEDE